MKCILAAAERRAHILLEQERARADTIHMQRWKIACGSQEGAEKPVYMLLIFQVAFEAIVLLKHESLPPLAEESKEATEISWTPITFAAAMKLGRYILPYGALERSLALLVIVLFLTVPSLSHLWKKYMGEIMTLHFLLRGVLSIIHTEVIMKTAHPECCMQPVVGHVLAFETVLVGYVMPPPRCTALLIALVASRGVLALGAHVAPYFGVCAWFWQRGTPPCVVTQVVAATATSALLMWRERGVTRWAAAALGPDGRLLEAGQAKAPPRPKWELVDEEDSKEKEGETSGKERWGAQGPVKGDDAGEGGAAALAGDATGADATPAAARGSLRQRGARSKPT